MNEEMQGKRQNRQLISFASVSMGPYVVSCTDKILQAGEVDMHIGGVRYPHGRWDLINAEKGHETDDVLFEVQGYVWRKNLPPITNHTK